MTTIQLNFHLYAKNLDRTISFYTRNFQFELLGQIGAEHQDQWAALTARNALLWLGQTGATRGLILLIEKDLEALISRLKTDGVTCFIPEQFASDAEQNNDILATDWGKHAWILDSEENVVMLFEPIAG